MSTADFNNYFLEKSGPLKSYAFYLTKDRDDALDLFQETALKAVVHENKFTLGTNLQAWLMTIMRNTFINNYRKEIKSRKVIDSNEYLKKISESKAGTDVDAEAVILFEELMDMVNQLDESLRVPFQMYFLGHKYHEIAETLHLPLGTMKSRMFLARKALKKLYKKQYSNNT